VVHGRLRIAQTANEMSQARRFHTTKQAATINSAAANAIPTMFLRAFMRLMAASHPVRCGGIMTITDRNGYCPEQGYR